MVANTGTYLDAPSHRYADGVDVAGLALDRVADLPGLIVHADSHANRAVGKSAFDGLDVRGKAVLIHTGWDKHWRTDQYFEGHPFLTSDAAAYLAEAGAALVGIDSLNIDDTADMARPVHSTLLGQGIPIVEHLTELRRLPDSRFQFFATPVKVKGMGTFPVRAFGLLR